VRGAHAVSIRAHSAGAHGPGRASARSTAGPATGRAWGCTSLRRGPTCTDLGRRGAGREESFQKMAEKNSGIRARFSTTRFSRKGETAHRRPAERCEWGHVDNKTNKTIRYVPTPVGLTTASRTRGWIPLLLLGLAGCLHADGDGRRERGQPGRDLRVLGREKRARYRLSVGKSPRPTWARWQVSEI
jgi:hypothetical protein